MGFSPKIPKKKQKVIEHLLECYNNWILILFKELVTVFAMTHAHQPAPSN